MKHLAFSILILLVIACGTIKPQYYESRTERPLAVIDSLAKANKLEVVDTTYWTKTSLYDWETNRSIKSYMIYYELKKDHSAVISLTKTEGDPKSVINFRIE